MDSSPPETNKTIFGDRRIDLIVMATLLAVMLWNAPQLAVYWHMSAEPAPTVESNHVDPK